MTPSDSSSVSNVCLSEFISAHTLVMGHLDFISPSVSMSSYVTFLRNYKNKMNS